MSLFYSLATGQFKSQFSLMNFVAKFIAWRLRISRNSVYVSAKWKYLALSPGKLVYPAYLSCGHLSLFRHIGVKVYDNMLPATILTMTSQQLHFNWSAIL